MTSIDLNYLISELPPYMKEILGKTSQDVASDLISKGVETLARGAGRGAKSIAVSLRERLRSSSQSKTAFTSFTATWARAGDGSQREAAIRELLEGSPQFASSVSALIQRRDYVVALRDYAAELPIAGLETSVSLEDVYVPLPLVAENAAGDRREVEANWLALEGNHIVVGEAGGGKSSLLRSLALREAQRMLDDRTAIAFDQLRLPALIHARTLLHTADFASALRSGTTEALTTFLRAPLPSDFFAPGADEGHRRWLVLIDGLDEVNEGDRDRLLRTVASHATRGDSFCFILAARPEALAKTVPLEGFDRWSLPPLQEAQRFSFIDRYLADQRQRETFTRNLALSAFAYIAQRPLFLAMSATLFAESGELFKRKADLLEHYVHFLCSKVAASQDALLKLLGLIATNVDTLSTLLSRHRSLVEELVGGMSNIAAERELDRLLLRTGLVRAAGRQYHLSHDLFRSYFVAVELSYRDLPTADTLKTLDPFTTGWETISLLGQLWNARGLDVEPLARSLLQFGDGGLRCAAELIAASPSISDVPALRIAERLLSESRETGPTIMAGEILPMLARDRKAIAYKLYDELYSEEYTDRTFIAECLLDAGFEDQALDHLLWLAEDERGYSPDRIDYSTIPTNGTYNTGALNLLQLPLTRYTAYAATDYEISEHAQFYGSFNFTHYDSRTVLAPSPAASSTGFSVPVTNPFISDDLAALLASRANPTANFLLRKRFTDVGPRISETTFNVFQIAGGVRGDTGYKDWTYDVYASYGRSEQNETQSGNVSHSAVQTLLNAADGGASLCDGGYDPFGLQTISASCLSYISRQTKNRTVAEQQVVEANLQGGLFNLPTGQVRGAFGASYKRDTYLFEPDSLLATGDVVGFNAQDAIDASTNVKELYGELLVPVLKDLPFVRALNLEAGYRLSDYNTVGKVSAYKLDGNWEVVEGFRLRGGYQRAVRAPSIGELYSPQNQDYPSISEDPCAYNSTYRAGSNAATVRALCLAQGVPSAIIDSYTYANTQVNALTGGNPDLKEEKANTFNAGLVWTPRFDHPLLERLSMSLDYYSIDVKDAIGTIDASTALDKCYSAAGNPSGSASNYYCSLFVRSSSTGEIDTLTLTNLNLAEYKTSGVDFQVDWGFGLGAVGLDDRYGAIKINLIGSYLDSFKVQSLPGEDFTELKGTIGNTQISSTAVSHPEWKYATSVSYQIGPVEVGARWRYIGDMVDASDASEKIGAVNYYDLNATWNVTDTYSIRGGVTNLTDKQPPYFSSYVQANTDPSTYDVLGRRFFLAVKAKF